mgnify:CR=1 FL=1
MFFKKTTFMVALLVASPVLAAPVDMIGGPDGSTQTIHHCGFLPTSSVRYTTTPATVRIVERKLYQLGYAPLPGDGVFNKKDAAAVKRFQRDNGLAVDGVVGPATAQRLAYNSHPAGNVHRCFKQVAAR